LGKKRFLMIGCGTAALSALKQMRRINSQDEVKLITMEPYLPYSPTSLPYLLSKRIKESEIPMATDDFFDRMKAELVRGKRVEHIDIGRGEVTCNVHERESYDCLLIATGSEPALPSIPGLNNQPAFHLRTLDDAKKLLMKMKGTRTAIILGAGLIGLHMAECLAERKVRVTVVEMLSHILPTYFDPDASRMIQDVLEKHGVRFFTGHRASEVSWKKSGVEVSLEGGRILKADLLLIATGVKPRVSFLKGSGIKINEGIWVDSEMRTNVSNIFAAGDVAEARNFLTGDYGLNPILPNAAEQGKIAGNNMVGSKVEYEGWLPMNTFNYFGHLAVSVGKPTPCDGDEARVEKIEDKGIYKKIIYKGGRLLGATFLDINLHSGVIQYLIKKRVEIRGYEEGLIRMPVEISLWLMHEAEKRGAESLED
jgi:phenylglyoxylate dehydrogenase epsilon subunit